MRGGTNPRDLQQMGRVDCAARQDHLARSDRAPVLTLLTEHHTHTVLACKQQFARKCVGLDAQIWPTSRLRQKRARCRTAQAAVAGHLRIAHALVLTTVEIDGVGNTSLLRGLDETAGQRKRGAVVLDQNWPILSPLLGLPRPGALHRLEVGQHPPQPPTPAPPLLPPLPLVPT